MKIITATIFLLFLISCNETQNPSIDLQSVDKQLVDRHTYVGEDFLIDDQHSYLGFKIKYFGFSPVRGRFNDFDGTLFYDPEYPADLSVSVVIDVNSINTGNERRDDDLKSEGSWFDAATHPIIVFTSQKVVLNEDSGFDLKGTLRMKGISKDVTISFEKPTDMSKDWAGNDQVDFSGKLTINRQDYGVFGGDFWSSVMENGLTQLSDEVEIEIDMHCRKADYQMRYETADSSEISKIVLDRIMDEGIESGLEYIDILFEDGKLSSGKLSTTGYTLNGWNRFDDAIQVFRKRLEFYPERITSLNQLGITYLHKKEFVEAHKYFQKMLTADSNDTRALEYIGLLKKLSPDSLIQF